MFGVKISRHANQQARNRGVDIDKLAKELNKTKGMFGTLVDGEYVTDYGRAILKGGVVVTVTEVRQTGRYRSDGFSH